MIALNPNPKRLDNDVENHADDTAIEVLRCDEKTCTRCGANGEGIYLRILRVMPGFGNNTNYLATVCTNCWTIIEQKRQEWIKNLANYVDGSKPLGPGKNWEGEPSLLPKLTQQCGKPWLAKTEQEQRPFDELGSIKLSQKDNEFYNDHNSSKLDGITPAKPYINVSIKEATQHLIEELQEENQSPGELILRALQHYKKCLPFAKLY